MKTGKVIEILGVKEHTNEHGTTFYHKLKLDNGDVGQIGKKIQNAFAKGDELTYTLEAGRYGDNIKEIKPNAPNGHRVQTRSSCASFALAYAKDLAVAQLTAKPDVNVTLEQIATKTITIAKQFLTFLKENE